MIASGVPALFIDIETRSTADLTECGAHVYARDPTTQPLCLVYAVGDEEPQLWLPTDPAPSVFRDIAANPDWIVVAHNYEFERAIFGHVLLRRHGFPAIPDECWRCTMRLALANARPAELGLLVTSLGLPYSKDPAARRAMLAVSRPRQTRASKSSTLSLPLLPAWDEDPVKLALVYLRCLDDVNAARAVWQSPRLRHLMAEEATIERVDAVINRRGVLIDRVFVVAARDMAIGERNRVDLELAALTNGDITSAGQVQRFLAAVNGRGHSLGSMDKRAVAAALAAKPDEHTERLLKLRQEAARASVRKYDAMLAQADPRDDRLRGAFRYHSAHTGRWAGSGPQLQNLKKNESSLPLSLVDAVRAGNRDELARYGPPLALLGDLIRAALCASPGCELMAGDFSAIESRTLAWLAGEQWKLDAYRTFDASGDMAQEPYRVLARRMLHLPNDAEVNKAHRDLGKAAELAFGFGGSVGAWRRIARKDQRTDAEIQTIVTQYRAANASIVCFWRALSRATQHAFRAGTSVKVASPAKILAAFDGRDFTLVLPSGRALIYPDARLVPGKFEGGELDVEYLSNAQGQWVFKRAWFGTLVENVTQAVARDLLATALLRVEARELSVVAHCHDEITVEVPVGTLSNTDYLRILLEPPAWAGGLPLNGHVHSGPHYLEAPDKEARPLTDTSKTEHKLVGPITLLPAGASASRSEPNINAYRKPFLSEPKARSKCDGDPHEDQIV